MNFPIIRFLSRFFHEFSIDFFILFFIRLKSLFNQSLKKFIRLFFSKIKFYKYVNLEIVVPSLPDPSSKNFVFQIGNVIFSDMDSKYAFTGKQTCKNLKVTFQLW